MSSLEKVVVIVVIIAAVVVGYTWGHSFAHQTYAQLCMDDGYAVWVDDHWECR